MTVGDAVDTPKGLALVEAVLENSVLVDMGEFFHPFDIREVVPAFSAGDLVYVRNTNTAFIIHEMFWSPKRRAFYALPAHDLNHDYLLENLEKAEDVQSEDPS